MTDDYLDVNGHRIYWEKVTDSTGATFTQLWMCKPPDPGVGFMVIEEYWNEDFSLRLIERIRIVG